MRLSVVIGLVVMIADAQAAPPPTLTASGRLTGLSGNPVDGSYALTVRLFESETAGTAVHTETFAGVPVVDGAFLVSIGVEAPFAPGLFTGPPLWVEVAVDGDPPLTRVAFSSVPYALAAGALDCTACVPASALDPSVAARFVDAAGDAMTGDLDLGGHTITNFRAHPYEGQAPPCDAARLGAISFHLDGRLQVCMASGWRRLATCATACALPNTVPCGASILSDCGDTCPGKGTGLAIEHCVNTANTECGVPVSDECGNPCGNLGSALNNSQCAPPLTPCAATVTDACGNDCGTRGTFCDAGTICESGGCIAPGATFDHPGASCADIHNKVGTSGSGLYWIDPDGAEGRAPMQAYCDMVTDGGGWTLVLHAWYSGTNPPTAEFQQNQDDWMEKGVGSPGAYVGIASSTYFVMPLTQLRTLAGPAQSLRFQSDNEPSHSTLTDFEMTSVFGLNGSNEATLQAELCGGNSNCFLDAPGFSAVNVDNDNLAGMCSTNGYSSVGWWYDDCFSYNPFYQTSKQHFSGYSSKDPTSNHWSWWVR